jgi:hypothetical protein
MIIRLITLIPVKKGFATHYSIQFLVKRNFTRPNINALIEKWMPSDMLSTPRSTGSEYVMRTKGNDVYISKMIELEKNWSTIMIVKLYGN